MTLYSREVARWWELLSLPSLMFWPGVLAIGSTTQGLPQAARSVDSRSSTRAGSELVCCQVRRPTVLLNSWKCRAGSNVNSILEDLPLRLDLAGFLARFQMSPFRA